MKKLQVKIAQEEIKRPQITRDFIRFFFDKYRQMDLTTRESQQRLVDGFVNAIHLYDDRAVIVCNYKGGTEMILFSEVNGSDSLNGGEPEKRPLSARDRGLAFPSEQYQAASAKERLHRQ